MEGETEAARHTTTDPRHPSSFRSPLRRGSAFLALIVFSPFVLPLLCVCFPFVCLIFVFLRLAPVKWRARKRLVDREGTDLVGRWERVMGTEEGEIGILERYLEDQLGLVKAVFD